MNAGWMPKEMRVAPVLDPGNQGWTGAAEACSADQPLLPEGPARQLRQTRADADAGVDQSRLARRRTIGSSAIGTKTCCRAHRRGKPFPEVVGISVHLTFARRAYELARVVSAARGEGHPRRIARVVVSR